MLGRLAPLALALTACTPMPPIGDPAGQEWFGSFQHAPGRLEVPILHDGSIDAVAIRHRDGIEHRYGDYDLDALAGLASAWRSGVVPHYGIVGEVGGARLTGIALETRTGAGGDLQVVAVARVLHPYPFQLSLEAAADGSTAERAEAASSRWGPGLYYARAELPLAGNHLGDWRFLRVHCREEGGWSAIATATLQARW